MHARNETCQHIVNRDKKFFAYKDKSVAVVILLMEIFLWLKIIILANKKQIK